MRDRHRSPIALLAAAGAILLLASAVLAKEGATVALTNPIPRDAAPGSTLTVEFTVMVPGATGPTPMIGSPVFVRLIAHDRSSTEGFGTEDRRRAGTYVAEVVVPTGGIASAEFGLRGSSYSNGQSQRSDIMFVVEGQLFTTGTAPAAAPIDPMATRPAAATTNARPIIALGVGGLLVAGLVLATRRLRPTRAGAR